MIFHLENRLAIKIQIFAANQRNERLCQAASRMAALQRMAVLMLIAVATAAAVAYAQGNDIRRILIANISISKAAQSCRTNNRHYEHKTLSIEFLCQLAKCWLGKSTVAAELLWCLWS